MTQLTNYSQLIGKTIKSFPMYPDNSEDLIIFFEDDTFVVLSSYSDMDSNVHSNFYVNESLTNFVKRELGFITNAEWIELVEKEKKESAINQLNWLKREYPELLEK